MNVSNLRTSLDTSPPREKAQSTKHAQRTEATKCKLLAAALGVFARDGFEAARLESIARAAGFTRGAFYAHYHSKEELFFALMEQQLERRLSILGKQLAEAQDEEGRLEVIRRFYLESIHNPEWAILTLEFKLFALRRSDALASLVDTQKRMKEGVLARGLSPLMPSAVKNMSRAKRSALEAVLSALVVQSQFDSSSLPLKDSKNLLGHWFDLLVNT